MEFSVFFPVVSGIVMIIIALIFATAIYLNLRNAKSDKSDYLKNRQVSEKKLKSEMFIFEELKNEEIKCHTLKNCAQPYNAKDWVTKMEKFTKKKIYEQLLKMEGHNKDE